MLKSENSVCFFKGVFNSAFGNIAVFVPGDVIAGNAAESEAVLEFCHKDFAKVGSGNGYRNFGSFSNSFFHCVIDCVNAVISGSAELVKGIGSEFFGIFCNVFSSHAFGCVGIEVRKHGNFLRNYGEIVELTCKAVETVASVIDCVVSNNAFCLGHEDGSRLIIDGHENEGTVFKSGDLGREVGSIAGENGFNNCDGRIKVLFELFENAVGISVVGFIENADFGKAEGVYIFCSNFTLVAICEAHLISVFEFRNFVAGSGRGKDYQGRWLVYHNRYYARW